MTMPHFHATLSRPEVTGGSGTADPTRMYA